MDIWFEIKAGKRIISETGKVKVKEEEVEASQLTHLTTLADNLAGVDNEILVDLFKESLKLIRLNLTQQQASSCEIFLKN